MTEIFPRKFRGIFLRNFFESAGFLTRFRVGEQVERSFSARLLDQFWVLRIRTQFLAFAELFSRTDSKGMVVPGRDSLVVDPDAVAMTYHPHPEAPERAKCRRQ